MDEDKYGPPEPLDLPSQITETEVTIQEPEDPGPPPTFGWHKPTLFTGYTPAALSLMDSMVSGIRTVYSRILRFMEEVKRLFR